MQFGSLQEIFDQHIHDGRTVALEGFTHLIPFAAGLQRTKIAHAGVVLRSRKVPHRSTSEVNA